MSLAGEKGAIFNFHFGKTLGTSSHAVPAKRDVVSHLISLLSIAFSVAALVCAAYLLAAHSSGWRSPNRKANEDGSVKYREVRGGAA